MPTENRSSNTEMVSVPRYSLEAARDCLVICQDQAFQSCECESCPQCGLMPNECTDTECSKTCQCTTCEHCMNKDSIDSLTALLAQPDAQPHPEPIAWMVGTAFWWTKEEAERDAAETGLPIVGLGPMSGVTPEQLQGEPVAWMDPRSPHMHATISNEVKQHNLKFGGAPASAVNGYTIPLYTHADPAEVERLRLERRRMDQALSACANERDTLRTLRTLLVEALAFLDEAYKHDIGTQLKREIKAFYLSASAEPSAPVAQA